MGEANRRGSRTERVAQAEHRARTEAAHRAALPTSMQEAMDIEARCRVLFSGLTTPNSINEQVLQFARTLSTTAPIFLDCMPEAWSRQSCCNMNVARYIDDHGGRIVCGYRIWYNEPLYIEGERHAVWADGDRIRDVSFVDTGETRTLFVADGKDFGKAPQKVRLAFGDADKSALAGWEAMMSMAATIETMSPEDSWNCMPTYEQWLAGKRMPNLIPLSPT